MRYLLTLAAAAFLAVGCARNQDESGAAPDQGDDATVTATDTSTTTPTDSTMGQVETDSSFVQQDTTMADPGMSSDSTMTLPGAESDSVGAQGEVQTGDTTTGTWTDSTATGTPSDTTAGTSDTTTEMMDTTSQQ